MQEKPRSAVAGIAGLLILMIVILAPALDEDKPTELRKMPETFPEFTVTKPDVSFAFEVEENRKQAYKAMWQVEQIREHMDRVQLPTVTMEKTSLGTYYITGYTSIECGGSTMTASGATCHKADSYEDSFYNPTTCAIDPKLHDFGDLFFIEGFGCYVAEDTGSAVKGKHLDLYFWDGEYNYALSITGYYTVYAIEFVYGEVPATNYDIQQITAENITGGITWN